MADKPHGAESVPKNGFVKKIVGGITTLTGVMTALAALMTATTGLLGVVARQQSAKIDQQSQQISKLRHGLPSITPAPDTIDPPTTLSPGARYLPDLEPTVDHIGWRVTTGKTLSTVSYPHSLSLNCAGAHQYQAYDISGSTTLSAMLGVADDATDATGAIAEVIFSNQDGRQLGSPVDVSLSHPKHVTLSMQGVTQLEISCSGRDEHSGSERSNFLVTLGDAAVNR